MKSFEIIKKESGTDWVLMHENKKVYGVDQKGNILREDQTRIIPGTVEHADVAGRILAACV